MNNTIIRNTVTFIVTSAITATLLIAFLKTHDYEEEKRIERVQDFVSQVQSQKEGK